MREPQQIGESMAAALTHSLAETVATFPAPAIQVHPQVTIHAAAPREVRKTIERDGRGFPVRITETTAAGRKVVEVLSRDERGNIAELVERVEESV